MGYYSTCACYEDIIGSLRLDEGNIFMTISLPSHDENIQVTLNAMQAKQLGDTLTTVAGSIQLADMDDRLLGDIQLNIEIEDNLKEVTTDDRNYEDPIADCGGKHSNYPESRRNAEAVPAA